MPTKNQEIFPPFVPGSGELPGVSLGTQMSATGKVSVRVMAADALFPYGSISWDHICTATFKLSNTALTAVA